MSRTHTAEGVGGKHTPSLPDVAEGRWSSPAGREMAERYAGMSRDALGSADHTDYELANALYLATGDIAIQTAAKERMRWLSVQHFLAQQTIAELLVAGKELSAAIAALAPHFNEPAIDRLAEWQRLDAAQKAMRAALSKAEASDVRQG